MMAVVPTDQEEVPTGTLPADFCAQSIAHQAVPSPQSLPRSLLYSTSSGLGGTGLNTSSYEGVLAAEQGGFLQRVLFYGNEQDKIPRAKRRSLNLHPVRVFSFMESQRYYAAKKHYVARAAAKELATGKYDCFHSWSGDCFRSLVEARRLGIPSMIDIPTWHRNKGKAKSGETQSERESRLKGSRFWQRWFEIGRVELLAEYDLADLILAPSRKSAETFLAAGIPQEKLHYVGRGVDVQRYQPGTPVGTFRAIFVGALIERKGVHLLLEAWHKLGLKEAELVLAGRVHPEIKPYLKRYAGENVRVLGFSSRVAEDLKGASVFVFPSECEGFAKSTLEAAACGLPLIATRESGDAIVDGETGFEIPANNMEALAEAIRKAHSDRAALVQMGRQARQYVENCLTWDHYRQRLLQAYAKVMGARAL